MHLRFCRILRPLLVMAALFTTAAADADYLEITPFVTANRTPLVQIFGLPSDTSPALAGAGRWQVGLSQDIASLYTLSENSTEKLLLDGELYRWTLSARYGLRDDLEVGLELPLLLQSGGFLDRFIMDWHNAFGLPQGGRDTAPLNRLSYQYTKNGKQLLSMSQSGGGIGDISLLAGYRLLDQRTDTDHDQLTLRGQLKLPTGDTGSLTGSGSVDLSLFLTGSMNRSTEWGMLGLFGSAGGMVTSDGSVLAGQRKNLVALGTAGLGWSPLSWLSLKTQVNLHTPLFTSDLTELGNGSVLLTTGGTLKLPGDYLLDIGVGEDVAVGTAPDVTFHLGLSKRF